MTKEAKAKWREIVESLPATHFRRADYELLRAYCEAAALHAKATREVAAEPVLVTKHTTKISIWMAVMTATSSTMAQMATKLRLSVSTRISPQKAGNEKPQVQSMRQGLMFGGNFE